MGFWSRSRSLLLLSLFCIVMNSINSGIIMLLRYVLVRTIGCYAFRFMMRGFAAPPLTFMVMQHALAAAMLVTPAATAYLLTRRLLPMMFVSAAIGALSSVIGLYLSYYFNIVSGSAIVLTATLFFLFAFIWKRFRK